MTQCEFCLLVCPHFQIWTFGLRTKSSVLHLLVHFKDLWDGKGFSTALHFLCCRSEKLKKRKTLYDKIRRSSTNWRMRNSAEIKFLLFVICLDHSKLLIPCTTIILTLMDFCMHAIHKFFSFSALTATHFIITKTLRVLHISHSLS